MNERDFEKTLERLNSHYEDMPTQSSTTKIMANIKKSKKRKWNWARSYQKWQVAALIIVMVGIGYVLGASQFMNQPEIAMEETAIGDTTADSAGTMESASFSTKQAEPFGEEEEAAAESGEEINILRSEDVIDDSFPITITDEEGNEVEKQVKVLEDKQFSFSTYYDANFHVEEVVSGDGRSIQIYADYGEGLVELALFEIFQFESAMSYDDQVEAYRMMMTESGYIELESNDYLLGIGIPGQAVQEFLFQKDDVNIHVAPVQHGEEYLFFKTSTVTNKNSEMIEYMEGFNRELTVILNRDYFKWIYN
ncbi:hypothetical protein ACFFHM_06010 [Halalkalibacter kiskunsagensis]|uniref:DUF4367 domain-containing protein n=1 Tax=Halalkalibacter kiskunsagensis TaxID=1548599 RepID=A0ABV6KE28_9BACI